MVVALAALVLSLATATAPALSDPGAGVAAPAAAAPAHSAATAAAPAPAAEIAAPVAPIVGAPTVGTQTISAGSSEGARGFPSGPVLPLVGFALCGVAAIAFARRKQQATPKMLEIVETHGLGGRRSLIVARIAGETVLLGASEAGLTLLLARPGETVAQSEALREAPPAAPIEQPAPRSVGSSWLGKLRLARTHDQGPEAKEPSFEELLAQDAAARSQARAARPRPAADVEPALLRQPLDPLAESAEDQELRRKLAQGRSGRIA